jgi:hypothetical protein
MAGGGEEVTPNALADLLVGPGDGLPRGGLLLRVGGPERALGVARVEVVEDGGGAHHEAPVVLEHRDLPAAGA